MSISPTLEALLRARPRDIAAVKARFREDRAALHTRLRERPSGAQAARALSDFVDGIIVSIFEAERDASAAPLCLCATGGNGRRELAPFSDVDLVLLHRGDADRAVAEALATRLFQTLWDLGLEVGHAVRSIDDCARVLTNDLVTATALLDARRVAGDEKLFAVLDAQVKDFLQKMGTTFLRAKLGEAEIRWQRRGAVAALAEPNVKESKGGLRDVELLRLFERAGLLPPQLDDDARQDADDAQERLLETRLLLHLFEGKKQDRLDLNLQPRVAVAIGFRDTTGAHAVEALIADCSRSARAVERALGLARWAFEKAAAERGDFAAQEKPRRLGDRFLARGGRIELASDDALASAPDVGPALELFLHAQREKVEPSEAALEAVRRVVPRVDTPAREAPANARTLRSLMSGKTRVAASLRAMHRTGLLGEYLPEFGTVDGLATEDPYHEYTVDEHSLRALEQLEHFADTQEREDLLRVEVLGNVRRPDILRLGVLLHDCGKGKGGGHVQVGAAMMPEVARRLGLSEDEGRLLHFLVDAHLEMSRTTEQRDYSAPETLAGFAKLVGDVERLEMLYLLTVADARAVGPHAFPKWKDALLTGLFQLTRDHLERSGAAPMSAEERRRETLRNVGEGLTAADLDAHLALVPSRYPLEVDPFDVANHLRLVRDLLRGRDPATAHVADGPLHHLWICTRDRPGLFANVAGAIAAKGANIIAADAFTRADGVVLDKVTIVPAAGQADDATFWEGLEKLLADVLAGRQSIDEVVERARARVPYHARREGPRRPTAVKVSNKLSDRLTVIDIGAEDRPGLLYDIARRLSSLGLDIHCAKISTRASRAADVFYVSEGGGQVAAEAKIEQIRSALAEV